MRPLFQSPATAQRPSAASARSRHAAWALCAALVLSGCAISKYIPPPTAKDVEEAGRNGQVTTLANLTLGRKLYVRRCSACHSLHKPAQLLPSEWPEMVERMSTNANLKPDQQRLITQYLVAISASFRDRQTAADSSQARK